MGIGPGRVLVGLLLFALLVRVGAALVLGMSHAPIEDEQEYIAPAASLASGGGYAMVPQQSADGKPRPTAYRMPLPAMLIAPVFAVTGPRPEAARWLSVVFGSLVAPCMFLFARRFLPDAPALVAALAAALYPTMVESSTHAMSEAYFMPALLISMTLSVRALQQGGNLWYLPAGLAWGVTALIRPHAVPIALAFALYVALSASWKCAAYVIIGTALPLMPWAMRNARALGTAVILATESGETLLGANNPYVVQAPHLHGLWIAPLRIAEYREHLRSIDNEVARDREQVRMARDYLRQHPAQVPQLMAHKLWRWLNPLTSSSGIQRYAVLLSYGTLLLLVLMGLALHAIHDTVALRLALIASFVLIAIAAVYWGGLTRGRMPLELIWIPFASSSAHTLWTSITIVKLPSVRQAMRKRPAVTGGRGLTQ